MDEKPARRRGKDENTRTFCECSPLRGCRAKCNQFGYTLLPGIAGRVGPVGGVGAGWGTGVTGGSFTEGEFGLVVARASAAGATASAGGR